MRPEARDPDVREVPLAPDQEDIARFQPGGERADLRGGDQGPPRPPDLGARHPLCHAGLDGEPRGEAGLLDDPSRVLGRERRPAASPRLPEARRVLADPVAELRRLPGIDPLGQGAQGQELAGAGDIEEAELDPGIAPGGQADLRDRLVEQGLKPRVPIEEGEQVEGEPVLRQERGLGDEERRLARRPVQAPEPLVGPADRIEREHVVEEPAPRPHHVRPVLRAQEPPAPDALGREQIGSRRGIRDDGPEPLAVDLDGPAVAVEPQRPIGLVKLRERRRHPRAAESNDRRAGQHDGADASSSPR